MRNNVKRKCKIHGVLEREDIHVRIRKSLKPHHNPEWIERICKLCKKEKDKNNYNNSHIFELRKKLNDLLCHLCKEVLPINNFTNTGLKSKYPYCRNCIRSAARKHYRKSYLKDRYGITQEIYDKLLHDQHGVCAICNQQETRVNGLSRQINSLSVDHNHKTGKVRALLCHLCNSALGKFQDSSDILRKAADYLDSHNAT